MLRPVNATKSSYFKFKIRFSGHVIHYRNARLGNGLVRCEMKSWVICFIIEYSTQIAAMCGCE